jgi:hypothetical protein
VNFFGHAVVAGWHSREPAFVLGAMLPDFVHMLGARLPRVSHPELEAGLRCHFETDRCFHNAPTFLRLQQSALRFLAQAGVGKGPRRAAAHVGVELLIDDALKSDADGYASYRGALAWGQAEPTCTLVRWEERGLAERFRTLCERLARASDARLHVTPRDVASQLAQVLARRPRLHCEAHEVELIARWAVIAAAEVQCSLGALLRDLELGCGACRDVLK